MATMYGTIPTLSSDFQADDQWNRTRSDLGRRRPWKEMLSPLSLPDSFNHSLSRIKANVAYFHTNYIIIVLFALFLSLLWHPVSLIVFVVMMFAWLFLYFLRDDDPIVVFGYEVDERVVVTLLSILTVVLLVARATVNVVVGVSVGLSVAAVHGVFRKPIDLIDGGGHPKLDLMEAASASFSSYA